MNIQTLIEEEIEKRFDKEFPYETLSELTFPYYQIKSFIRQYTKKLINAIAKEIIGKNLRHITDSKGFMNEAKQVFEENKGHVTFEEIINEIQKEINVQNRLRSEQRQKLKEIVKSLK